MTRHRTNIELDLDAVEVIMARYDLPTKTEAVNLALRTMAGRKLSKQEVLAMYGARLVDEVPADVGPRGEW
ncbi:type II toxin-antitoxin system VapB family antitoxin [Ornithinibacter aureus]|nr:type II toxin-antitoxin system VapB family antitoxin [Ornithinibacter aureus]KAF0832574.1 VapB protein of antitoxin of type II toxin-antitoxin system [Ornithinibacter aureus]